MISHNVAAIFGAWLIAGSPSDSATGCIQPETRVVHHELALIDVLAPDGGGLLERSSGLQAVPMTAEKTTFRLRLQPDERVRMVHPDGHVGEWFSPLASGSSAPESEQTPAWTLGAVWYNVFPERFENAEPSNDQGWPHGTRIPWESDWFEVSANEFEASANRGIASPRRYRDSNRHRPPLHDVVYERRYGGDLQGIVQRLDHIAALGATAIWLCPIFESTSLHKYDAADHRHIDPSLAWPGRPEQTGRPFSPDPSTWIWTPADRAFVDKLLPEVQRRSLHLILDGVWNHVGTAHPAFRDAVERGQPSPYFDWFRLRIDSSGHVTGWDAWDHSNGNLPNFRQIDGDLAPGPKQYTFDVTTRWMDPNGDGDPSDGIDGWRLDVANEIGMAFWEDWRSQVRDLNPEAALFGELWFDGGDYFGGRAFDAQMNYPLAFVLIPWLSGIPNPTIAADIEQTYRHHPATNLAQMNLLGSHDTARLVSMLANPGLGYDQGAGMGSGTFDRSRPGPEVYERLELAYAVLTVLPGSPMVFAGDELGMWGGDDPENRKPLPWPDHVSDTNLVSLAETTTARIGAWLRLRTDAEFGPVLRYGGYRLLQDGQLLIIERDLDGRRLRLVANPTDDLLESPFGFIAPRSAKLVNLDTAGQWAEVPVSSEKP